MKMTKRILKNAEPFVKISIGNARSTEITPKKYGLRNTRRNRYRLGFENVESAIILEDDCVIEPSFIRFAAELLEKYKDDERVTMISGLNHFENWNCGKNSYFFTRTGAIAAWATWRRVWSKYDFNISDFGDAYNRKVLFESFNHKRAAKARINTWRSIYEKRAEAKHLTFGTSNSDI